MDAERQIPSRLTRVCVFGAPACLLGYGVLRLMDGIDGSHRPGLAWNLGHVSFLAAFVLFGVLIATPPRTTLILDIRDIVSAPRRRAQPRVAPLPTPSRRSANTWTTQLQPRTLAPLDLIATRQRPAP